MVSQFDKIKKGFQLIIFYSRYIELWCDVLIPQIHTKYRGIEYVLEIDLVSTPLNNPKCCEPSYILVDAVKTKLLVLAKLITIQCRN